MAIDMKKLEHVRQAIGGFQWTLENRVRPDSDGYDSDPPENALKRLVASIAAMLSDEAEERRLVTDALLSPGPIQDDEGAPRPYFVVWMYGTSGPSVGCFDGPYVRWAPDASAAARDVINCKDFGPAFKKDVVVHVFDRKPVLTVKGIEELPKKA